MNALGKLGRRLWRGEEAHAATEYAVLIGLIAVAVIGAMSSFGVHMNNLYSWVASTVPAAGGS